MQKSAILQNLQFYQATNLFTILGKRYVQEFVSVWMQRFWSSFPYKNYNKGIDAAKESL